MRTIVTAATAASLTRRDEGIVGGWLEPGDGLMSSEWNCCGGWDSSEAQLVKGLIDWRPTDWRLM